MFSIPGEGPDPLLGGQSAVGAQRSGDQRSIRRHSRWRVGTAAPAWPRRLAMARTQPLAFPIRLPDVLQAEALRLLDASRQATSELLLELWPQLDRFAGERTGPAWKQVEQYAVRRSGHGRRPRALRDGTGRADLARTGHAQAGLPHHPAAAHG